MQPVRYRPPTAALDVLLMLSNYLRDLNTESTGIFLAPHLKNVISKKPLENIVRANLREINTKAGEDDDLRLTLKLSMAQEMLEQLRTGAQTDPASPRCSTSGGSTTSTSFCLEEKDAHPGRGTRRAGRV